MARGGSRYGSGRPGWHRKAEHCLRLDVRDLHRRKLLRGGYFGWQWRNAETGKELGSIGITVQEGALKLQFSADGSPCEQLVPLSRTPCNFGGSRLWFRCPRCGQRAAVLFLRRERFACRACAQVVYRSQSEDFIGRTWRRQQRAERNLGANWARPKGMHQRTYQRLLHLIFECEGERDAAIQSYLARLGFR